jgi:hypothetical protein
MPALQNEAQLQLALQAIERDKELSLRGAAKLYSVSFKTLGRRRKGIPPRVESIPKSRNLNSLEEGLLYEGFLTYISKDFRRDWV